MGVRPFLFQCSGITYLWGKIHFWTEIKLWVSYQSILQQKCFLFRYRPTIQGEVKYQTLIRSTALNLRYGVWEVEKLGIEMLLSMHFCKKTIFAQDLWLIAFNCFTKFHVWSLWCMCAVLILLVTVPLNWEGELELNFRCRELSPTHLCRSPY